MDQVGGTTKLKTVDLTQTDLGSDAPAVSQGRGGAAPGTLPLSLIFPPANYTWGRVDSVCSKGCVCQNLPRA